MPRNKIKIEARGRNGWFRAASINVFMLEVYKPPEISVSVYSRQKGGFPPIYFQGPREEMVKAFSALFEAIKKIGVGEGSIEIKIQEGGI